MYYLLYTDNDDNQIWEIVSGEDAMQIRVDELLNTFNMEEDDIIVFDSNEQL